MPKEDENDILYINLPIQIVSGTNGNDIGYHNILLKKLPDGNYVVEPNQIILQDEDNLQRNESYMFSSDVEHPQAKDVPKNIGLTISKNSNKTQKSFEQETCNEICQIPSELNGFVSEENTLLPENHNTFKVHKVVEETPLENKYQNNKQILQKGPGRPRKDGTVRPRIERLGPFQCSFCDKEYDLYAELRKHEKQHIKEKTYQCSKCNASFNLMCNYRLHMATHETELHSCPECQKIFSRQASLRAHLMLHCVDDNILCVNCGVSVETQALLEQHKKACVEEKSYPGKENLLSLNSENTDGKKTNHGKLKHGKKLNCSICKKYFKKPSQLERHFRCHTGEKPYKCHICNRGFSQKGSLIIHRVKHTGAKPYSCTSCPAKFAQKGNLVAHRKRVHPVNIESVKIGTPKKVFSCQKCSCVFKRLGSLNSHMNKLHSPANISTTENSPMNNIKLVMNQLSELQNMTSNIDVLQQAVNNSGLEKKYCAPTLTSPKEEPGNHTVNNITVFDNLHGDKLRCYVVKQRKIGGIKWRQCNYCTREFRKPSDLIRHLRIHTKEKPFKCPQCYRRFTVKSTLTAHLKTHTGLKTFVCPICQKLFSSSSSLKVHTRLHTGTKPFICRECDRSFRTSSQLQTHFATNCTSDNNPKICDQQIVEQTSEIEEAKFNDISSSEHYYICTTCGRSFHDENILNDHLLTHTSLDTFKCLVSNCSMYFNTASALKIHMEKHNEVKYYICPSCPKTFKTKVNCREHRELHKENENLEQYTIATNTKLQKNCESIQSQPTAFTHFLITSNDNIITTKQEKCVENMKEDNCTNEDIKQNFNSALLDHVLPISNCIMLPKDLNIITKSDHYSGERVVIDNTSANLFQVSGILQSTEGTNMQNVVSVKSDPNISLNDYSNEDTSIPLFTSNNQSTLLVTTKSLNDQPVNALSNMNANAQENVASYLISNLQYSNQNSTNNDEETEQNASLCKYFNENSVKSPVSVITNNILLKNLMVNFQNQFDILCLDDQGSSLDILGEENCIQDEQNYISEQQDQLILSPASPSFTHSCVDDVQPVDFSCGNRESSEQVECQNDQIDEFGENVQCTGNVLQETSENDMGRGRNMEPQFEMKYVPDIEDNYSTNSLRTFSPNVNENQLDETGTDSDKYIRCKTKNLSASEQAFLDYINNQHKVMTLNNTAQHPNKCSYCVKSFKKPSDLIRHIRVHTGEKPYPCNVCHKKFSLKTSLDCHMTTHNKSNKTVVCSVCNSSFSTKGSLKVHMRLHTGSRPFECPLCKMTFRTSGHKRAHLLVHYRGATREGKNPKDIITKGNKVLNIMGPLTSNISNYSQTIENAQISDHEAVSGLNFGENAEYLCKNLDVQLLQGSFEKSVSTKDSVLKFNTISEQILADTTSPKKQIQKKLHMQQCDICDKTFKKPSQLMRHKLIHTGERPFQCNVCSKTFNQKNGLDTHMRHHTGLRPHDCSYCSKSFSQKGNLKTHIIRTHGIV